MTSIPSSMSPWLKRALNLAGVLVVALGCSTLVGWHARIAPLLQVHREWAPMPYNTALCFVLCGVALILLGVGRVRLVAALCSLVGMVGGLTLAEYLSGVDLRIDQALFASWLKVVTPHPGRMSPITASCFVLLGMGFIVAGWSPPS